MSDNFKAAVLTKAQVHDSNRLSSGVTVSKLMEPCTMPYAGCFVLQTKRPKCDTELSSLSTAWLKNASTTLPLSLTSSCVGV